MNRVEPPPPQHKRLGRRANDSSRPEAVFSGIPVSAGVAIGPVFRASEPMPEITRHKIHAADSAAEGRASMPQSPSRASSSRSCGHASAALPEESQAELAPLIDAYIRMLGPSRLIRGVRRRVEETLLSAESAVDGRGRCHRHGDPGAGRAGHAGRRPGEPAAARRGGAGDRPAAGAQSDAGAVPQLRRPAARARC